MPSCGQTTAKLCERSLCNRLIAFARQRFSRFEPINATVEIANVVARQAISANKRLEPLRALKLAQQILAADISGRFIRRKAPFELAVLHNLKPRIHEPHQDLMYFRMMLIDRREKVFQVNFEHTCEVKELIVTNPDEPRLDFRDGATSHVPTGKLQFDRQHVLRPSLLVPQFSNLRAD
jgi:hypothetical protein